MPRGKPQKPELLDYLFATSAKPESDRVEDVVQSYQEKFADAETGQVAIVRESRYSGFVTLQLDEAKVKDGVETDKFQHVIRFACFKEKQDDGQEKIVWKTVKHGAIKTAQDHRDFIFSSRDASEGVVHLTREQKIECERSLAHCVKVEILNNIDPKKVPGKAITEKKIQSPKWLEKANGFDYMLQVPREQVRALKNEHYGIFEPTKRHKTIRKVDNPIYQPAGEGILSQGGPKSPLDQAARGGDRHL